MGEQKANDGLCFYTIIGDGVAVLDPRKLRDSGVIRVRLRDMDRTMSPLVEAERRRGRA